MSDSGGMTSQGAEPITTVDLKSTEIQAVDGAQTLGYSSSHPAAQSWSSSTGEQSVPNSSYYYDPQSQVSVSGEAQGMTLTSHASTSSNQVGVNSTQPYSGYAPYSSSTIPYDYNAVGFQNYYYSNHPLGNDSTTQQVEGDQNPGAAYQPLSAFPNSGSYVAPTSYLGTYYNAGDNQTGTGYENNSYNYQTGLWNDANYHNYPQHLYPSYTTSATTVVQSSTTASTNSLYYQQQYNKWPYYYNQAMPAVNGIAGTDNSHAATSLQSAGYSAVGVGAGYPYSSNQPPPPGTTSRREDSKPPGVSSFQEVATPYNVNKTWEAVTPAMQTPPVNQQSYFTNLLKPAPLPNENHDNQPKVIYSQAPHFQHSTSNHVPEIFQTPQQTAPTTEVRQFSKVQIPTNPRIAPNVGVSLMKTQKESSGINAPTRPAYVSVSMPKASDKSSVEDHGKTKVIAKATADGTLFTKEWDIEPLFTLTVEQSDQQSGSQWPITKRSPSRRRSRWEPVADENLNDKLTSVADNATKNISLGQVEAAEKVDIKNSRSKSVNGSVGFKFLPSQQQSTLPKFSQRAMKKPRFSHTLSATENVDHSSDSDKEQNLTKYYASAIALADSPEEKKKRENRVKRFEKGHGNQTDSKTSRSKIAAGSGTYTSRTSGLLKPTSYENGQSKAVEDIDWDSLTVKGTCQEIEKHYLRLTSAPEPSTVRPEEILEKALHMVQTSQKSYLYRCDQLKSIRQDLTVQRIQNTLTVKVYETHARLALEAGDLPEYNQCQSQLKRLYAEGIKGCYMEFSAYNLLSIILHSNNKRELLSSMARLSTDAKNDKAVKHALSVHSAVSSGNYILFFRLYKEAPNLNTFFMNIYMEKMRFEALKCMCKSYRPVVPVSYITRALSFSKSTQGEEIQDASIDGFEECEEWLRAHGAILTSSNAELQLDTKASSSTLYMPEVEDAVAHGDANLAVDNFLTRTL
ncbi:SAC3 family protein A isoform X3 [Curcuma longa]|uniref:SAC3 family protein A isoform X3 n=1 Tax=Curcuma longa TaxID=136217 RepID=UPI003D9F8C97